MGALVDDLLLLARLDQGRPVRRDPVDLSRIATDAVADARALEPDRPMVGAVDPGVIVSGDEDRLRQVVGNLLANVRVHAPAEAAVEVVVRADPDGAELRVVDHGPGIDVAHGSSVFDRFYRADPGRSREHGGTGLGLSIAAAVVAAHGGRIWHEPTPGGAHVRRPPPAHSRVPSPPRPDSATAPSLPFHRARPSPTRPTEASREAQQDPRHPGRRPARRARRRRGPGRVRATADPGGATIVPAAGRRPRLPRARRPSPCSRTRC
jgi:hypothetical protein